MTSVFHQTLTSPLLFALLGLTFGSFGNVVVYRLPRGESLGGRSRCPACGGILSPFELIPIASFLIQGGRCRRCRKRISWRYPLVEILSMLLFLSALGHTQEFPFSLVLALTLWLLLMIAAIDLRTTGIPDVLNFSFLALAAFFHVSRTSLSIGALVPALIGGGFFGMQYVLSRGRFVGSGDIVLGAGIGFLLGSWQHTIVWLWCSYILGSLVAILLIARGKKTLSDIVPFGPFLAAGALISLLWGERIIRLFFGSL